MYTNLNVNYHMFTPITHTLRTM